MLEASAPDAVPAPLGYAAAPAGRRARALRWVRPGTAGFFLLIALLAGAAAWGAWKGMLYRDRKAFDACAMSTGRKEIRFTHPPSRGALRHLARMPGGPWTLRLDWPAAEGPGAWAGIGMVKAAGIHVGSGIDADALLVGLARPDSGLKALTWLDLCNAHVTDAGLLALAGPDSGLKALRVLLFRDTSVTDAGVKALQQARPALHIVH